ncbi:MAG: flagellar hook-length control protein FliK [Cyanobacteria bacterium]|nr:flagellar hook-length control protein FliK [Cyanobacteriota bacterium]
MNLHLNHIIDQLVSSLSLVQHGGNAPTRKASEHAESKQFATALKAASTPATKEVKETLPNTQTKDVQKPDSQKSAQNSSENSASESASEAVSKKTVAENDHDKQEQETGQPREISSDAAQGVELLTPPLLAFLNILPLAPQEIQPSQVFIEDHSGFDSSVSSISAAAIPSDIQTDTQNLVQALSEFVSTSVRPDQNQSDQNSIGSPLPGLSGQITLSPELKTALGSSLSNEDIAAIEARVRQKLADATEGLRPQSEGLLQTSVPESSVKIYQELSPQTQQPQTLQPFTELAQRLVSQNETGDKLTGNRLTGAEGVADMIEKPVLTLNASLKAAPIIQGILQKQDETKVVSLPEKWGQAQPVNPYATQNATRFSSALTLPVTPQEPTETHLTLSAEAVNSKFASALLEDKPDAPSEKSNGDTSGVFSSQEFSLDATIARGQLGAQTNGLGSLTMAGGISTDQSVQTPSPSTLVNWTHDSVVDQVQDKISQFQVNSARKEISFNLTPDDLGTVRVHLNSTSNHQLSARFIVTSVEAQSALENNVHQLKQSLEQQGVRVDQVNIVLAGAAESKVAHGNNASNQQDFSGNQQQDSTKEQTRDFDQRNHQNEARQELASQFQENLFRSGNQDIQYDWNNLTQAEQSQQENTLAPTSAPESTVLNDNGTINLTI